MLGPRIPRTRYQYRRRQLVDWVWSVLVWLGTEDSDELDLVTVFRWICGQRAWGLRTYSIQPRMLWPS